MKHSLTIACVFLKSAWQAVSLRSTLTALSFAPMAALQADSPPWWDHYPLIIQNADAADILSLNGDVAFNSDHGDPSWGIYVQKAVSPSNKSTLMHDAGLKYITYYEAFGDVATFIIQLGDRTDEGYDSVSRNFWSWNLLDSNGGGVLPEN